MAVEIFQGKNVRIEVKDGKLWYNLPDVCKVLELSNPTMVARGIKESYLNKIEVATRFGSKASNFINDRGLLRLMNRSYSKNVEEFQDWIDERAEQMLQGKTVNAAGEVRFELPKTFADALRSYASEIEAHAETKAQLEAAQPALRAHEAFLDSERLLHISSVTKAYKAAGIHIGREGMNKVLCRLGYVYDGYRGDKPNKHKWRVTTGAQRDGILFEKDDSTAEFNSYQVRFTPHGFFYIYEQLADLQGVKAYVPRKRLIELLDA